MAHGVEGVRHRRNEQRVQARQARGQEDGALLQRSFLLRPRHVRLAQVLLLQRELHQRRSLAPTLIAL